MLALDTFDELEPMLEDFESIAYAMDRQTYEDSFYSFVKAAWSQVEPARDLIDNWHIRELCTVCEQVFEGDYERVIINIPPGTLKSLIVNVFFPAWMWAKNPRLRVLSASYGQHLSIRDNLRVRTLIESRWFQKYWPVKLVEDQNTKTRFNTHKGGWRVATSVGGPGTGEHPNFIIIDDPLTAMQATSAADRLTANEWFDGTVSSRGATSGVRIIVVMQRLHQEDLTGHLLAKGGWELVRFPMRYEKCTCPGPIDEIAEDERCVLHKADPKWVPDPRDPRTMDGELLCEAIIDERKVRQLELDLGPFGAAGQLQQRPSPEGGGLFKREWFKFVDKAPLLKRLCRGWDTAGTEGAGDWTVGVRMSEELEMRTTEGTTKPSLQPSGRFYVEDVIRGQWGPDGVDKNMRAAAELDGVACAQREEKEGGGAGIAVIAARKKLLVGYDYSFTNLGQNKIVRAKPFRSQVEGGNVFLVRAAWNEEYITELSNFPTGKHDDQVDGSSCAFNAVLLEPLPKKQRATW